MATPQQTRNLIEARLPQVLALVSNFEESYAEEHEGKYWQGLITHSNIPGDGNESVPDVGVKTPTDQPIKYPNALLNSQLPMALRIDTYNGPKGYGYIVNVFVRILGETWSLVVSGGKGKPDVDMTWFVVRSIA